MLLKQLPNVQAAIRHYDISMKLCPLPLIDETKWEAFKELLEEVDEVITKAKMIVDGKGDRGRTHFEGRHELHQNSGHRKGAKSGCQ